MAIQLDILQAIEEKDKGIKAAEEHANTVVPDWSERAMDKLKEFLKIHSQPFQAEEVRSYAAIDDDFPFPPHERAWGSIMKRAAVQGLIKKIGLAATKNVKAHCANSTVWQKI